MDTKDILKTIFSHRTCDFLTRTPTCSYAEHYPCYNSSAISNTDIERKFVKKESELLATTQLAQYVAPGIFISGFFVDS